MVFLLLINVFSDHIELKHEELVQKQDGDCSICFASVPFVSCTYATI